MKKSLIALAVLAASGAAMAQSSVTLYGIADIWVGKVKGSSAQAGSGGLATSRLGFKGSEDLGGGLSATFQFEQAINLGNGATNAKTFDRQANMGLAGGFGTLKLGRNWNAMDDVFGASNSGFDSALSANAVWQNGYTGAADAQLYYATPEFAGVSAAVSTQLNGNVAAGEKRISAGHVKYAGGPVAVALGYEKNEAGQKGTMLNGSYDLGAAKLLASYYTTKADGGGKTNSYQLGADVPLGAVTLSVGYASSKVDGESESAKGFGVAAGYSLSKRTMVYTGYRAENAKAGDGDFFALGLNHKF
jgi:predicted porin